ncbi:hypothetical protein [Peribacillus asahii]|nr:hypothetical protein [Peribacillus asahii]USK60598.1 hypothetical protein LIT37_04525 [Peribacillus asahii]
MNSGQDYTAATLSQDALQDLQQFEGKLRTETNKEVIVIAYEKEKEQ